MPDHGSASGKVPRIASFVPPLWFRSERIRRVIAAQFISIWVQSMTFPFWIWQASHSATPHSQNPPRLHRFPHVFERINPSAGSVGPCVCVGVPRSRPLCLRALQPTTWTIDQLQPGTPTPLEPSKWTPIVSSTSKSNCLCCTCARKMARSDQKWQKGIALGLTVQPCFRHLKITCTKLVSRGQDARVEAGPGPPQSHLKRRGHAGEGILRA